MSKFLVKVRISLSSLLYGVFQKWKYNYLYFGHKHISKCYEPNTRDAEVRANNIVSLYVKYLSERSSFCPNSNLIKSISVWTFQIKQYLGCGGLQLKTPATNEQILG